MVFKLAKSFAVAAMLTSPSGALSQAQDVENNNTDEPTVVEVIQDKHMGFSANKVVFSDGSQVMCMEDKLMLVLDPKGGAVKYDKITDNQSKACALKP